MFLCFGVLFFVFQPNEVCEQNSDAVMLNTVIFLFRWTMTQFLPPNLLALFAPRDPIPFLPQLEKLPHEKHHNQPYSGIAPFIKHFEVRWFQIVQLSPWRACLHCALKWSLGIIAGHGYHFWIDGRKEVCCFFFQYSRRRVIFSIFCPN